MVKNTLEFEGLTEEQISKIQSLADTFRKENEIENERKRLYLSYKDPNDAFTVYMQNAKPEIQYSDVWQAAIKWYENKITGEE